MKEDVRRAEEQSRREGVRSHLWSEGPSGQPWGHKSPFPSMAADSQLLQLRAWNLLPPPASHSHHKQDSHPSPGRGQTAPPAPQREHYQVELRPCPHSPQAQIPPHKAIIIVNRLSQILCVTLCHRRQSPDS